MREATVNLWDCHAQGIIVAVTTNGAVTRAGVAVMGKGCAKEAAARFPALPVRLGLRLRTEGNRLYWWPDYRLVTFPTKHDWRDRTADLALIQRSASALRDLIDANGWSTVAVPRPGCGAGLLHWEVEVRPILQEMWDDRVLVVHRQEI
ncbi:MAG: ADP-ribose-binding protein [Nitrospirota bacterium]